MRTWTHSALLLLLLNFPLLSAAQGPVWLRDGGSSNFIEYALDVDVDEQGYIYVGGEYADSAFLWDSVYFANGSNDMFMAKFDPHGNIEFVETFGSADLDRVEAVDVGPDGSFYATGYGKVTFNRPPAQGDPDGRHARDIIIVRTDNNGNRIWGLALDGDIKSEGSDIVGNSQGECYLSSWMETTTYFATDTVVGNGGEDGMICKFGQGGDLIWARVMGGTGNDQFRSLGIDRDENIVAGGYFQGSASTGGPTLNAIDGEDACLVKYDSSGSVIWARRFGGTNNEQITAVRCAPDGSIYFVGNYYDNISIGSFNFTSVNSQDIFYGKADANGNVVWAKTAGGNSLDFVEAIEVDERENLYFGGFYFDQFLIEGQTHQATGFADDLFYTKFDSAGNLIMFETTHYFDTRAVFGVAVDKQENMIVCGNYIDRLEFGNDTVYSVNQTMDLWIGKHATLPPNVIVEEVTGPGGQCVDSALNIQYRVEGYFEENNVFVGELSSPTGSFASPYVVGGANSSVDGTIFGAVPLLAPNGNGYRTRIVSTHPVVTSNNNGTDLTINGQLSPPLIISDDTVVCNGSSVLPTIPGGYASQLWSTGATTPFANITTPGPYWVMAVDNNGCQQTFSFTVDECVSNDPASIGAILVYPNPGSGLFKLKVNSELTGRWVIDVFDLNGRTVWKADREEFATEWQEEIDLSDLTDGIYFLRTSVEDQQWTKKLILRK